MDKKNYIVVYFYKDEDDDFKMDSVIVNAKDKKDAEIEARKIISIEIKISKIEEYINY